MLLHIEISDKKFLGIAPQCVENNCETRGLGGSVHVLDPDLRATFFFSILQFGDLRISKRSFLFCLLTNIEENSQK